MLRYSLFIAHANDYLPPSQMVAMSSGLLMVNGAGAVIGSPLAAFVIDIIDVTAFMPTMAFVLFTLSGFIMYRRIFEAPFQLKLKAHLL